MSADEQASLELQVVSAAQQAIDELGKVNEKLDQLAASSEKAATSTAKHASESEAALRTFEKMDKNLEGLAQHVEFVALGFEHFRAIFGAGAVTFGFAELIKGAEDFTLNISKLTTELNGDAVAGSQWNAIASELGINVDSMARGFATLQKQVNDNAAVLREMGIATQDSSGHLLSMNTILSEVVDYFQQHAGASNNAALATALFGRAAADILPALEQGKDGLKAITDEAQRYGLIIDTETLQRQLALTYQIKDAQEAVHGLAINFGEALLPAVAAVGQGLSEFVSSHLQQLINGVNQAVSYLIGIGEAFGLWDASASQAAETLSQVTQATGDYGDATGGAAGGTSALADQERALRDATKDATEALQQQIRALDDQQSALDKSINTQINALQDQLNQGNFEDKQTKVKQQEADKQREIERLKSEYVLDVYLGQFDQAANVQQQITKLTEEQANLQTQFEKNAHDEQIKNQIEALKKQQQNARDATAEKKRALEDEVKAVEDAAQKQLEAMQAASQGSVAAVQSAGLAIPPIMDQAGKDAADKFKFAMNSGAEQAGITMGEKLKSTDWHGVGDEIGREVGAAMASGAGDAFKSGLQSAFQGLNDWARQNLPTAWSPETGINPGAALPFGPILHLAGVPGFAEGGHVRGGSFLVGERGPEVLTMKAGGAQVTSNDDLVGLLSQQNELLASIDTGIAMLVEKPGASLADLASAMSAASTQRMRGIAAASPV